MSEPWTEEGFIKKLEETGLAKVKTNLAARVYGDPVRDDKGQIAQRWVWDKEAEAESVREARSNALAREANDIALAANALASAANEIAERAERRASTANRIAVAAAIVASASAIIAVLPIVLPDAPSSAPVSSASSPPP